MKFEMKFKMNHVNAPGEPARTGSPMNQATPATAPQTTTKNRLANTN